MFGPVLFQNLPRAKRLKGLGERVCCLSVFGEEGLNSPVPPYLLMPMAITTGCQPEYSTSRVASFLLVMMTQMGSTAAKQTHTKGFT